MANSPELDQLRAVLNAGDFQTADTLIAKGTVDINARVEHGQGISNPLIMDMLYQGHPQAAEYLMQKGAATNGANNIGETLHDVAEQLAKSEQGDAQKTMQHFLDALNQNLAQYHHQPVPEPAPQRDAPPQTPTELDMSAHIAGVKEMQNYLKAVGYDLGHTGKNHDGIDGDQGTRTNHALEDFCKKHHINPKDIDLSSPTPNAATQQFCDVAFDIALKRGTMHHGTGLILEEPKLPNMRSDNGWVNPGFSDKLPQHPSFAEHLHDLPDRPPTKPSLDHYIEARAELSGESPDAIRARITGPDGKIDRQKLADDMSTAPIGHATADGKAWVSTGSPEKNFQLGASMLGLEAEYGLQVHDGKYGLRKPEKDLTIRGQETGQTSGIVSHEEGVRMGQILTQKDQGFALPPANMGDFNTHGCFGDRVGQETNTSLQQKMDEILKRAEFSANANISGGQHVDGAARVQTVGDASVSKSTAAGLA